MSQENVELVRSGYRAFAEGDIETVLSVLDPQITLEEREATLDTPSTYHIHQALVTVATVSRAWRT